MAALTPDGPEVITRADRNLAMMIQPRATGGWELDAVWADDFHHQARRRSTPPVWG